MSETTGAATGGHPDTATAADPAAAPRLAPLPPEAWDDLLRGLAQAAGDGAPAPTAVFATLGRHPELFRRWLGLGGALLAGRLPGRLRELVVLRTALHCASAYEWCHHVILARREGVGDHEIAALRREPAAGSWAPSEQVALQVADELHRSGSVGDATWGELTAAFAEDEVIELVMLVGFYHMVSFCLRAFGVQVEPQAEEAAGPVGHWRLPAP